MLVKVWNDNVHEYKEKFRDKDIKIPAKGFIVMEHGEAEMFRESFNGVLRSQDDTPDPRGFKMIRIEEDYGEVPSKVHNVTEVTKYVCHIDGATFDTEEQLKKYVLENFKDRIIVDEAAEAEIVKRKRGRPAKAATL